jgi:hypothetical protein
MGYATDEPTFGWLAFFSIVGSGFFLLRLLRQAPVQVSAPHRLRGWFTRWTALALIGAFVLCGGPIALFGLLVWPRAPLDTDHRDEVDSPTERAPWNFETTWADGRPASGRAMPFMGDLRPQVWRLFSHLQLVHGSVPFEQLEEFYSPDDWRRLQSLPEKDRADKARSGLLGLPLVPADTLARGGLSQYRIRKVVLWDRLPHVTRMIVTIRDEQWRRIKFPLEIAMGRRTVAGDDGAAPVTDWFFGIGPVERE